MKEVQIRVPLVLRIGARAFESVGEVAHSYGSKALVVSDPTMEKLGVAQRCTALLAEAGITSAMFADIEQEPTLREVEAGLALCKRERCDVVVAVGGGSCLDTAKAIAVMMTNEGTIGEYRHRPFDHEPLPLICVPTTAGTGSEVTMVTVITDPDTEEKMMIKRPQLLPLIALVDPLLTYSCPPSVTAATGVDALCHAIEAFLSREANPVTDAWAAEAIQLIDRNLIDAYRKGNNKEAREAMSVAAMMAGLAFSNASVTLVHGMSRPIGARFHVPHGISNAMLLPAVMEATARHASKRLAAISRLLHPEAASRSESELAQLMVVRLRSLCRELRISNLRDWGIPEEAFMNALGAMADDAIMSGSPARHPHAVSREEIMELYRTCYNYEM